MNPTKHARTNYRMLAPFLENVNRNDGKRYRPKLRAELDRFLWQWLQNIQEQGFDPNQQPDAPAEPESNGEDATPAAVETSPDGQALFPLD